MKIIKGFYPHYYNNDDAVKEAVMLWNNVLETENFTLMQKALKEFVKADTKGFPPVIGQLIGLGKEIKKTEWEAKQREQDQLPAPKVDRVEMPEELRKRMNGMFNV